MRRHAPLFGAAQAVLLAVLFQGKGKRQFRAQEQPGAPIAVSRQPPGLEENRRNAHSTAQQEHNRARFGKGKAVSDRPHGMQHGPGFGGRKQGQSLPSGFVQQFDPAFVGIGKHDRKWPPLQQFRTASQVHEAARPRRLGAARRAKSEPVLASRKLPVRQHLAFLDEDWFRFTPRAHNLSTWAIGSSGI